MLPGFKTEPCANDTPLTMLVNRHDTLTNVDRFSDAMVQAAIYLG